SRREIQLRSPIRWLHSIKSPVFMFEGYEGNIDCLRAMSRRAKNPLRHCLAVKGTDHFGILAPTNQLIASRVLSDTGPKTNLTFTESELAAPFSRYRPRSHALRGNARSAAPRPFTKPSERETALVIACNSQRWSTAN